MKYRNIDRNFRSTVTVATWFGNLVPVRVLSERGNSYTDNTVVGFTVLELHLTLPAPSSCYLPCLGPLSDVSPSHTHITYIQRKCRVEVTSVGLAHARPIIIMLRVHRGGGLKLRTPGPYFWGLQLKRYSPISGSVKGERGGVQDRRLGEELLYVELALQKP